MLITMGAICLTILAVLLSLQFVWGWRFARQFAPQCLPTVNDDELPRVVVLLPIRGADPSLGGCLRGLLDQNYPRYDVRIIIDSVADPSWKLVHQILGPDCDPRVQVSPLQTRRHTCSLKTSALLQAIATLDESCQVVALIDADVIPYRGWLRDLVLPLTDPKVGATTGIRWFMAKSADWGSLVRYLWNAAAAIQMHALHIPWGGSLALRADLFQRSDLLRKWGVSLWEDTGSYRTIRDLGLQLRFVPAATMVNRESTDLKSCFRFIRRQMLNVRLYHGSWPTILAHGIVSALALAAAFGLSVAGLASANWQATALLFGGLGLYGGGMGFILICIERHVHRIASGRGETLARISLKTLCAVPLAHVVYFACLASASVLGKVSWRGITYEFEGPWIVRMRKYRPYLPRKRTDQRASVV